MPANDPLKRYLDAGLEFTEMTRKRAETIVKDLVKAGEVQRENAQQRVEELVERSRVASTAFAEVVRTEVTRQLSELGLVDAPKKSSPAPSGATTSDNAAATAKKAAKAPTGTAKAAAKKTAATTSKAVKKPASTAKKAVKKPTGTSRS